jgi:small-conductance mechanosensitive channel
MGRAIDMENSIHKLEARLSDIEDILEMLSKEPEKPKKKVKDTKTNELDEYAEDIDLQAFAQGRKSSFDDVKSKEKKVDKQNSKDK